MSRTTWKVTEPKFTRLKNRSPVSSRPQPLRLETLEDRSVPSAVSFLRLDTTTQGSWLGNYGQEGLAIANTATTLPGYADLTFSANTRLRTSTTTDSRTLTAPDGTAGTGTTWTGYSFKVDLGLHDTQQHEIALYALDWARTGRSELIEVIDPATKNVLDSRVVSNFANGQYLVYNISGNVQFRLTALTGSAAYLSGVFFNAPSSVPAPINTAPKITDIANQSIQSGGNTGPLSFMVSDTETSATALTVTATSSNPTLVPAAGITLGGSGALRTVSVSPAAGQSGTATITLTVTDAGGLTATDTFTLTVASPPVVPPPPPPSPPPPTNTAPRISDIVDQSMKLGGSAGSLSFTVSDTETAANLLTVTATSSNPTLLPASGLALGGSGSSRTLSLMPAAGQTGSSTITVTVTDAGGLTAKDTFTFNVYDLSASGGVNVTPDWITTYDDKIPNFGGHPTLMAAQSGLWSDPTTWGGRLPGTSEIVSIPSGLTVTYDVVSDVKLDTVAVQAGATLQFRTDVSTRLRVTNFLVMPAGTLTIGTTATPVLSTAKAEVIINDLPIDTTKDPEQYGHGLIGLGTVSMHGAIMSHTFVRLALEPRAGDTTLTLSTSVSGWLVGQKLVLPDTRHLLSSERWGNYVPQWELPVIASISADGRVVTLTTPLQYDHLGARNPDGVLEFLPHVGVINRNVVVRSENARGTRGYTFFTSRANVDLQYTQFAGLGRTSNAAFDNTTFDAAGIVNHVGTNQGGRYAVYFNHLMGPIVTPANGFQFTFDSNAVFCPIDPMPFRWGVTLNDSSYGLVSNNVLYNWAGASIVGESGRESFNVIEHNFVVATRGDQNPRNNDARDGSAFWFRGFNNYIRDNVAANAYDNFQGIVSGSGFNLYWPAASKQDTPVPLFPGADTRIAGQFRLVNMQATPLLEFARNEVYGATAAGLVLWHLGSDGGAAVPNQPSIVSNMVAWNVWEEGFFGYPIANVLFDGLTVRGDKRALGNPADRGVGWTSGDYVVTNITIQNADIQGMGIAIGGSTDVQGVLTIKDSYFRNYAGNIVINMLAVPGSRSATEAKKTIIDNVRFDQYPGAPMFFTIQMVYPLSNTAVNYTQLDEVFVYNYNGLTGDSFQLYYLEQRPDYIVPQTTYYGPDNNGDGIGDWIDSRGSPEPGLTNAETWEKYGIAIGGAIAPTNTTRANIIGFVRVL